MKSPWLAALALVALGCTDDASVSAEDAAVSPDATAADVAPLACAAGTADCDGDGRCETDLTAPAHCGACGNACEPGGRCVAGACLPACAPGYGDCFNTGYCSDLRAASAHCGRCGNRCALAPGADAVCEAGECRLHCFSPLGDCDHDTSNGCETDLNESPAHCGACGNACEPGGRCVAGACLPPCAPGYGDCGNSGNCEDLSADSDNCGRCGNRCPTFPEVGSRCVHGQCVLSCVLTSPLRDCDGDPATGCEHDTSADTNNCGACGNVCAAGWRCINGGCVAPCSPGTAECFRPGQCVDLATVPDACGACGHRCESPPNATATCVEGVCGFRCRAEYADCDGDPANGCETHLPSSSAHCGACGNACLGGGACIGNVCHPPCSTTYRDCVSNDGRCETDTLASPDHCGACGVRCEGTFANGHRACLAGTCGIACDPGFADCDGASANGCEVDLSTNDGAHCGACGRRCATGEACVSGVCSLPAPRQWRPQSVSITTTRRPTFAWHLPSGVDGARLEVCADRACTRVEHTADVTGDSYRPPASVVFSEGIHYWRVWGRSGGRLATAHGPTWLFRAPATDAAYDTAWRIINDVDGDGVEDAFMGYERERALVLSTTGARPSLPLYDGFSPYESKYGPVYPYVSTVGQFAGDLDGDGYGDLVAVASAQYNVEAGVYWIDYQVVFFRGRDLGAPSPRWRRLNEHIWHYGYGEDWTPPSFQAPIGDVDGDGFADLGGGRLTELVSTFGLIWRSTNRHEDTELGRRVVASSGDVDGDGRSEAIIREVYSSASATNACVSTYGRAMGAPLPLVGPCAAVIEGFCENAAVEDVNGDGLADVWMGYLLPRTLERRTVRFLGGPGGLTGDRCELVP